MISVIIVTKNRWGLVKDCLDSVLRQKDIKTEVIVIDNGSSPEIDKITKEKYKNRIKLIRLDSEKGLGHCKKLGFKNSEGALVAFTDDDCVVQDEWLSNIKNILAVKDYDIIAGPVRSLKKIKFPWWWRNSLNWTIGIADINSYPFMPLGCNVAFKRQVLKDIMSDNADQQEECPCIFTEDTLRIKKALSRGYTLRLEESMVVYHNVDVKKLSFKYLVYRSWLEGLHWVKNEKDLKVLLTRVSAALVNPLRFIITLDLHHLLRSIVSISYIINFFR